MGVFAVGQPYRRKEDDRFIIGGGRYGDDVKRAGSGLCLFCPLALCPCAHSGY